MQAQVLTASTDALEHLSHRWTGIVHSIYHKTVNLSLGGQLLSLQTAGSPLSPISLLTDLDAAQMSALPILPGDTVTCTDTRLYLGHRFYLRMADVRAIDLSLTPVALDESLRVLAQRIRLVLADRNAGSLEQLFLEPNSVSAPPFVQTAQLRLHRCSEAIATAQWSDASNQLCGLIGLGIGLTPSGDDFLCGILAGLTLCGLQEHPLSLALHRSLQARLNGTNDISAAFLQCALRGQFSAPVVGLRSIPQQETILRAFSAIGHSSGMDTLCGILYLLQQYLRLAAVA